MNKEEIRKKIEEAKEIVGGDPRDPFNQIAFKEVLRMLLQSPLQVSASEKVPSAGTLNISSMPISEFLARLNIKTDTDRVVAILYHQLHNKQNSSTRAEILDAYATARIRKPTNLSDVIARCIRKGFVIEASEAKDGKKAWQITQTGERYVEELWSRS